MIQLRDSFGLTPVEYLQELGVLDENTVSAHSIRLTDEDIRILKEAGASIATALPPTPRPPREWLR